MRLRDRTLTVTVANCDARSFRSDSGAPIESHLSIFSAYSVIRTALSVSFRVYGGLSVSFRVQALGFGLVLVSSLHREVRFSRRPRIHYDIAYVGRSPVCLFFYYICDRMDQ